MSLTKLRASAAVGPAEKPDAAEVRAMKALLNEATRLGVDLDVTTLVVSYPTRGTVDLVVVTAEYDR